MKTRTFGQGLLRYLLAATQVAHAPSDGDAQVSGHEPYRADLNTIGLHTIVVISTSCKQNARGDGSAVPYYRTIFGDTMCEIAVSPPPRVERPFLAWALTVRPDGRLLPVVVNGRPLRGEFETAEAALQYLRVVLRATFGAEIGALTRLD